MKITGRVWKLGDNINTDLIIAGRYKYDTLNMKELAKHAFEDLDPTLSSKIREGDIIVAGENFGCGSSREHAPLVIKALGVKAIIAESFARIFYRNAINIGLMIIECKGIKDFVNEGETITIDFNRGELINESSGGRIKFKPVSGIIKEILNAGGLINYLKRRGKLK